MSCEYCRIGETGMAQKALWTLERDYSFIEKVGEINQLTSFRNISHLPYVTFPINFCPMCGRELSEPTYDKDSLEKLALEVREVIYAIYPDYYEKYTGEMLHSPEYVFSIAELICKEQEESE